MQQTFLRISMVVALGFVCLAPSDALAQKKGGKGKGGGMGAMAAGGGGGSCKKGGSASGGALATGGGDQAAMQQAMLAQQAQQQQMLQTIQAQVKAASTSMLQSVAANPNVYPVIRSMASAELKSRKTTAKKVSS